MTKPASERRLYRSIDWDSESLPGPLIRRAQKRAEDIYTTAIGENGPTPRQLAILIALHQQPGANLADLAASTGVDRNTVGEMVGRLIKRKLIARRRSRTDARAWVLDLTEAGEEVVYQYHPVALAAQATILAPIPEEARAGFIAALRLMNGAED